MVMFVTMHNFVEKKIKCRQGEGKTHKKETQDKVSSIFYILNKPPIGYLNYNFLTNLVNKL